MTVTVTATVEPSTGVDSPPRVRLNVVGSAGETSTTITRLDPSGEVVSVRTYDGNPLTLTPSGGTTVGLLYDYEPPYSAVVSYSTVESPSVRSADVTVPESQVWLIHPGVPALSMPIRVKQFGARKRAVTRGVFRPLGRASAVVVTDGVRKAAEFDLSIVTLTDDEFLSVEDLISDAGTLLLNIPVGKFGAARRSEYVAIGDIDEDPLSRMAIEPGRTWTLPCTVVDRPVGGSQAQRTYVDLLAYQTYADLLVSYPTYQDVLAGP